MLIVSGTLELYEVSLFCYTSIPSHLILNSYSSHNFCMSDGTPVQASGGGFDYEQRNHSLLTPQASSGSTLSNVTIPSSLNQSVSRRLSNNTSHSGSFHVPSRRGNRCFVISVLVIVDIYFLEI